MSDPIDPATSPEQSTMRYRALFESMDHGFCILQMLFDPAGQPFDYRFVEANPAFERHTGLKDAVGRTARELVPDLDQSWFRIYGSVALTGTAQRFENHAPAMGRWFDVYALRLGAPELRQVALIFTDITARKRAEQDLRAAEEKSRQIFESITDAFFAADAEWRLSYLNPQAERLLGPNLLGRRLWDVFPGLVGSEFEHLYRRAATEGVAGSVTAYYPHLARWYEVRAFPSPAGISVYFRDVSDSKDAEEALRRADRAKDEFIAILAHELRNPLAPLRNTLQALRLARPGTVPEQMIQVMDRQVDHLVRLVDDLLEVSRITQGKIELRKQPVDLGDIVSTAVETTRPLIDGAGHRLRVTLPPNRILLEADPVRLAQVVSNLLNNAAKYTDPGGDITLAVSSAPGEVSISVRDSGIGIEAAMLPHVFELFTQVERSAARLQGGLGIGLALVHSLVQLHGGSVEARSAGSGQGSEFIVRLPLAHAPLIAEPVARHTPAMPAHRVLVVDDNHDAADSLGTLLDILGCDVRVAYDGEAALAAAEAHRPVVVLLDLGMPGMDGYDVARRMRHQPATRDARLIALTGWGQEEDRRRSLEAGFDHHLVKPAEIDVVLELLASLPRPA
jgi:PAS domain S-box-containing protein